MKNQINKRFQSGGVKLEKWREKKSLNFINSTKIIKPQHAVQRLYELTKHKDVFITTEVGQHQMWAAQHYKFNKPNQMDDFWWIGYDGLWFASSSWSSSCKSWIN